MVNVLNNAQLEAIKLMEDGDGSEESNAPLVEGIAKHILDCWEAARTHKQANITERLLSAKRSRRGEYDPNKLRAIREQFGGSEEYGRIVSNKCKIAESWLRDVYLGQVEKPWTLKHSPIPSLTDDDRRQIESVMQQEIMQAVAMTGEAPPAAMIHDRKNELLDATMMRVKEEATLAIKRMEDLMADQMLDADWTGEWANFLNDFVTFPAAHFKGPIYRTNSSLKWVMKNGKWKAEVTDEVIPTFSRIDPFRAYPAPGATNPQEGYFIEHISMTRRELYDLIGVDGFNEEAIRSVLEESEYESFESWLGFNDAETEEIESGQERYRSPDREIDALEFYGLISGEDLLEWGVPEDDIEEDEKDYEVSAWLIGRHVIRVVINPSPLGVRPVFKACWEEIPGEYWGQGLPDTLKDVEGVANACLRSLVNNMGMASGPQAMVNVDRLPPGEDIEDMHPWKIWQVQDSPYGNTDAPIQFFQPQTNAQELLGVLDKFNQYADDWSLVPRYMGGSDSISGGIGRTASGMSMLFNAANKGLKGVVATIDNKVLSPLLEMLYSYNMMYEDDMSIKGDAQVQAKGAVALMQIESLQLRRNEFLQATANPLDSQIVGLEGRAEILREVAKGLEMDVNRVVPKRGEVPQAPQEVPPQGAAPRGQAPQQQGPAVTNNFGNNGMRSPV